MSVKLHVQGDSCCGDQTRAFWAEPLYQTPLDRASDPLVYTFPYRADYADIVVIHKRMWKGWIVAWSTARIKFRLIVVALIKGWFSPDNNEHLCMHPPYVWQQHPYDRYGRVISAQVIRYRLWYDRQTSAWHPWPVIHWVSIQSLKWTRCREWN
jgi:hypothetical protein